MLDPPYRPWTMGWKRLRRNLWQTIERSWEGIYGIDYGFLCCRKKSRKLLYCNGIYLVFRWSYLPPTENHIKQLHCGSLLPAANLLRTTESPGRLSSVRRFSR